MSKTEEEIMPDDILGYVRAVSRKQVIQILARQAASRTGLEADWLAECLMDRERQASSGIGGGVAIPHLRLQGLDRHYAVFARLTQLVDFDAIDEAPVDLVFLLLSPESDGALHLRRLSRVSRLFRDRQVCRSLRQADSIDALRVLLMDREGLLVAA